MTTGIATRAKFQEHFTEDATPANQHPEAGSNAGNNTAFQYKPKYPIHFTIDAFNHGVIEAPNRARMWGYAYDVSVNSIPDGTVKNIPITWPIPITNPNVLELGIQLTGYDTPGTTQNVVATIEGPQAATITTTGMVASQTQPSGTTLGGITSAAYGISWSVLGAKI